MNAAKFEALEREQTVTARKVLNATPIAEAWSASQVSAELRRIGVAMDIRTVMGCLEGLRRCGLVKEVGSRTFVRTEVRRPVIEVKPALTLVSAANKESHVMPVAPVKSPANPPMQPIDRLSALSERARNVAATLTLLAKDIDEAALEIAEHQQRSGADTEKLRQLQSLLKSLS